MDNIPVYLRVLNRPGQHMTRIKKNRSLKRIHKVKTGSASKLKRSSTTDRQSSKKMKNRTLSVYEKYLAENPEAREQPQPQPANNKPAKNDAQPVTEKQPDADSKPSKTRNDTPKSLLDQLDDVDFKDIY